ncbi:MAG TPA: energy transducer TonB [Rhodanobacteraceae bacterium]|nr:energy transducer TonB [Rhodanobacteraceae bacterium]
MKGVACLLLSMLVAAAACAAEPHVQASMVVTGAITVNPDGSVQSYTVHELDKLPPAARQIVQATVPGWQFVPIMTNGKAVAAEAGMSLRIVADMIDGTHARIRVASAAFGCEAGSARTLLPDECPKGSSVSYAQRRPPDYPMDALQARVGGEVFLVLRIDRNGHVSQAAARQVNLYTATGQSAHYRKVLADASLRAARRWHFNIPTTGPEAAKDHWAVQVPVTYWIGWPGLAPARHYGEWNAYIPGPVQDIPWAAADDAAGGGSDAIAGAGFPFIRDTRFVLKTALTDGHAHS